VDTSVVEPVDEGNSENPSLVKSVTVVFSSGVEVDPSVVLRTVLVSGEEIHNSVKFVILLRKTFAFTLSN
jgi:hypothetical protein